MINNDDFNILIETQQKKMKEDVAQQYISARKALKLTQEDIACLLYTSDAADE